MTRPWNRTLETGSLGQAERSHRCPGARLAEPQRVGHRRQKAPHTRCLLQPSSLENNTRPISYVVLFSLRFPNTSGCTNKQRTTKRTNKHTNEQTHERTTPAATALWNKTQQELETPRDRFFEGNPGRAPKTARQTALCPRHRCGEGNGSPSSCFKIGTKKQCRLFNNNFVFPSH